MLPHCCWDLLGVGGGIVESIPKPTIYWLFRTCESASMKTDINQYVRRSTRPSTGQLNPLFNLRFGATKCSCLPRYLKALVLTGTSHRLQAFSSTPCPIRSIHFSEPSATQLAGAGHLPTPHLSPQRHESPAVGKPKLSRPPPAGCVVCPACRRGSSLPPPIPTAAPHHQAPGTTALAQPGR